MNDDCSEKMKFIAPCGMNCGICIAYLREKKKCPGCRGKNENKSISCINCIIVNCEELNKNNYRFCFECAEIPCKRLKNLDKRYRTKYHMSMLDNLTYIKEKGIEEFLEKEKQKWGCPICGGMISCHNGLCYHCDIDLLKKRRKLVGWEED